MDRYLEVKIWAEDKLCFFLPVDPRGTDHKDPEPIDFSVPRLARYMHSAWDRHQDAVFWVDIDLGIKEGLRFYQTRSNAIILQGTSSPLYFQSWKIENWRNVVRKTIFVSSTTTKNRIETRSQLDWRNWSIGFYSWTSASWKARSTVFFFFEKHLVLNLPNQPNPSPIQSVIERGNPWREKTRPVHKRLLVSVCKKNLVLQIERGNLWSVKTIASCKFTIERGNLWNQARTQWQEFGSPEHRDTAFIEREQVQRCNRRGKHWLQHLRRAERDGETITWH